MEINEVTAKQIQEGFRKVAESYPTAEQAAANLRNALKSQSPYFQEFAIQKEIGRMSAVRDFLNKFKS
ncbi:hypothetical protein B9T23_13830 [Acinetobacter terrae]|uniref:hypothetical protein n=1 Tax=Acinetobacter terrae TaxID=2731247 RepID=UPI000A346B51|nr:hypothetical protein [Acinetobacter terrae]OTG73426.1 hypothetical protein B9T23_13830 [Acinetobacter terrae]